MKVKKVENYDAGYSRTDLLKKGALAVTAASLICGGLASCDNGIAGGLEYYPEEYDGGMTCVSSDEFSSDCESDEELTLDGDVAYIPEDGKN